MQRREFILAVGGTAATWPLAARAQQPAGRVYRVGCLSIASREQSLHFIQAFEAGLRSLGYRVGGNVTGLALDTGGEILGKWLELLKETLPNLSRVGNLWNPDVVRRSRLTSMGEAAQALGLTLVSVEARGLDALEQAFETMVSEEV